MQPLDFSYPTGDANLYSISVQPQTFIVERDLFASCQFIKKYIIQLEEFWPVFSRIFVCYISQ